MGVGDSGYSVTAMAGRAGSMNYLEAHLRQTKAQLGDWCTCPSRKTPEGQAKIRQLESTAASIATELKRAETESAQAGVSAVAVTRSSDPADPGKLRHIDVYA